MNKPDVLNSIRKYDYTFFGIATIIFIIGVINLYSATHASSSIRMAGLYKVQLGYFLISLVLGIGVSFIQPKNFFRYTWLIYLGSVIFLVVVLFLGKTGMGAQRWIQLGPIRFQPSEFTKLTVILALGRWFARHHPEKETGLRELIFPFLIALVPALLIILEPDLGTGLVILLIFLIVAFFRKLKWKTIAIIGLLGVITGGLMYQFGLKTYQRKRVIAFINPGADARGSGYNAIQSKIAIGSGQYIGKGFKKSSQASLNYLPENHTDFVFSIFNEEHGFFGSVILISLYLFLLLRMVLLATSVPRVFDSIVVVGVMATFFWHTFVNMGMVTGLLPIVGLPLPFMSYGGSSLVLFGLCMGVVTSISNSRNLF